MVAIITLYWYKSSKSLPKEQSHAIQTQLLSSIIGKPAKIDRSTGKPKLMNSSVTFSVSHTKTIWVMAVSDQGDIGIDIESQNRIIPNTVLYRQQTIPAQPPSNIEKVLKWTQFESEAKLKGTGIRFPVPPAFSSFQQSFVWQSQLVTLAAWDHFEHVSIVPIQVTQNEYPQCDGKLKLLSAIALKWELELQTPPSLPDDSTNEPVPIAGHF